MPSGAADAGEYIGRARFAMGDLVSSWTYSPNSVVVAADEPDMPDTPDEPVVMPDPDPTLTVDGNLGSFSGGSLAELAAAAAEACTGGVVIWAQDSGAWHVWSSSAPAIANVGFTTAFADGFASAKLLWIAACEADAMEDEG